MCIPSSLRRRIAFATSVPPIIVLSRSWLPPVRNTPSTWCSISSHSWRSQSARLAIGNAWASRTPRLLNSSSYRWPVSVSIDAVGMMAIRHFSPPHSVAKRRRIWMSPIFSSAPPTGMM
jgi:hypothetical protein